MPKHYEEPKTKQDEPQRIKLTARISLPAYHAISKIQLQYRTNTGRALPLWQIIDSAILAYAKQHNIKVGE